MVDKFDSLNVGSAFEQYEIGRQLDVLFTGVQANLLMIW